MGTNLLRFSWSFSVLLTVGCFSEPGDSVESMSGSSTSGSSTSGSSTSGSTSVDVPMDTSTSDGSSEGDISSSSSGCDGVIDACGVCDGSGSPCFGCTVPQASNFDLLADTYDGTCTCTPSGIPLADVGQLDTNVVAGGLSQWQSFISERGGGLHSISIDLSSPLGEEPAEAMLNVYQGEGNRGTRIISVEIEIDSVSLSAVQEFEFDDLVPIEQGEVYTWELTIEEQTFGFLALNNSNPYAGGRYSTDEGTDAAFRVDVVTCSAE